ncbi:unnamed protein product [Victoria cruziana]
MSEGRPAPLIGVQESSVGEEDRCRGSRSGTIKAIDSEEPIAELADALVEDCEASVRARIEAANIWAKAPYGQTFSEKETKRKTVQQKQGMDE